MPQRTGHRPATVSIHAPRAGGDCKIQIIRLRMQCFNPRPPCGGRRNGRRRHPRNPRRFNPRPPCGGRLVPMEFKVLIKPVSIHAPRAGGDTGLEKLPTEIQLFQSTPPVRGATVLLMIADDISKFQSTPPVRGATWTNERYKRLVEFQSTPPVRGATRLRLRMGERNNVSIHAPRAGGDRCSRALRELIGRFNPRPPCGGRR